MSDIQVMPGDPLHAKVAYAKDRCCQAARKSPNVFLEHVLRDEETGRRLLQAPLHKEWQDLCTKEKWLLIWSHVESGKTSQISVGRTLWEIGRDRSIRCAIVSNTQEQAKKVVGAIAKYIEQSQALHEVFPELQRGDIWTQSSLAVKRDTVSKDPTVQAFGIHGAVLGSRIDLLIMDDILDFENCRTPALRQELWDWIHATLMGRLTRNARIWTVGTAFHPDDTLHRFASKSHVHSVRYPILDPKTGKSRWPEKWPIERIEQRRQEMEHAPVEWARQFLCVARDNSQARFKQEWIDTAIKLGAGKRMAFALQRIPGRCRVYTGVDLAVQRHSAAGETVLFTILVHPNETREVLNIQAGKWGGPEIVDRVVDTHRRYMSIMVVENNAAQDFIVQFTRASFAIPIRPFTTGRNKAHPEFGVESLAAEMAGGKWIIPNENGRLDPEVQEWITEMLYYEPTAHTGDRLMASWFAREGVRLADKVGKVEYGRLDLTSR